MKRTFTLFAAILLLAVGAAAQKLSYQAVVRNSANELVYDATVTVSLKILAADGVTVQYAETQTATTNQNGLLTLIIGEHPTGTYSLANVNWTDASIRTDITLPTGDVVTNTMPVTAVPYALYADGAGGNLDQVQSDWAETNTASKAYIQNKPTIPTVPTNVSAFQNDAQYVTQTQLDNAGYLTSYTETDPQFNAWDKDYNDLTNKPNIPVVNNATLTIKQGNTTLGTFTANASTDQEIEIPTQAIPDQVKSDWNATTGPAEILNKPTIPTTVAELSDAANYTTNAHLNDTLSHYYDTTQVKTAIHDTANAIRAAIPAQVNADWNATGGPAEILNKPDLSVYATNAHLNDTLNSFATKDTLSAYATKDTLKYYTTINQIDTLLDNYLTIEGLCDSIENNCTNVALKNKDNLFLTLTLFGENHATY